MNKATFFIKVGGEYACFTNPSLKVERCTYPIMTPSAARGVLEAIFWKPQFRWEIREIKALKPIKQISIMRNEIEDRQNKEPIIIERKRQQRTSLILKDVAYIIKADLVLKDGINNIMGYIDQFARKLKSGQCHHTPYFGNREFAAWFEPANGDEEPTARIEKMNIGQMLFDSAYIEDDERKEIDFHRHGLTVEDKRIARGYQSAIYFDAVVENNVLKIPPEKYLELYEKEGVHV